MLEVIGSILIGLTFLALVLAIMYTAGRIKLHFFPEDYSDEGCFLDCLLAGIFYFVLPIMVIGIAFLIGTLIKIGVSGGT